MNYFNSRFTFSKEQTELENEKKIEFIDTLLKRTFGKVFPTELIVGYHEYDDYGKSTDHHIHFVYLIDKTANSLRINLKQHLKDIQDERKGIKAFSIGNPIKDEEIEDLDRLLRYPICEDNTMTKSLYEVYKHLAPKNFDYNLQLLLAKEEVEGVYERNLKAEAKRNAQSTYDKLEIYLKSTMVNNTKKEIMLGVITYYKEQKLSCNFATMMGYVSTYRLLNGFMTDQEALEFMLKKE